MSGQHALQRDTSILDCFGDDLTLNRIHYSRLVGESVDDCMSTAASASSMQARAQRHPRTEVAVVVPQHGHQLDSQYR